MMDQQRTNCDNCGGVLVDGKCPYCGSEWFRPGINFGSGYITEARVTAHELIDNLGRDADGRMMVHRYGMVYELELIINNLQAEDMRRLLDAIGMERLRMEMRAR